MADASIVGGKSITIREAPWQLLFLVNGGAGGMCGAVWIGQRWVLTAAHCVEEATPDNSYVYAGITRQDEAVKANRIAVRRIVANPDFPEVWKDIAVMELAADITSPLARPIRFATAADVKAGLTSPGVEVVATGWGGTNRDGDLADSLQSLTTKVADTTRYEIRIAPKGNRPPQGACGGDSGGPCVVGDGTGGWILAGLSSYITSFCGDPGSPSTYTRVSGFTSWIQQTTGVVTDVRDGSPEKPNSYSAAPGRLKVGRDEFLEIVFADLSGSVLQSHGRYFRAGEHAFPVTGLAPGRYVLRIRGGERQGHSGILEVGAGR